MPDPRPNDELLEALVTSLCDIDRAEKRGDAECKEERAKFGRLYGEVLARLDNTEAPFAPDDKVRVKPSAVKEQEDYGGIEQLDLAVDELYTVDHCYYEGKGEWMVALKDMRSSPGIERIGYGAWLFEKARIVRAA